MQSFYMQKKFFHLYINISELFAFNNFASFIYIFYLMYIDEYCVVNDCNKKKYRPSFKNHVIFSFNILYDCTFIS